MATSGTFTGSRGGGSTGPYLSLAWSRVETDIANNRSKIRLTLKLHASHYINFSASKSGKLHGQSFTYTGGMKGTGSKTLRTRDVWVNHNADGSKSQSFSASFNIAITYGGSRVNSLSVSGTASIDTIPRTSSFSISGNTLGSPITVSINRASSAFTHEVIYDLPDGSRRASWSGVTTSKTFTPSLADAQYIKNSTSGTAKIVVRTYHGSSYIGSTYKTFKMNVPSSIKPSATGLKVSISGNGRDKAIGKYVQGVTKVTASFTRNTMHGATVKASHILIRRASDNANSQTINGNSGTTSNAVGLSGTYEAIAWLRDSRGREASSKLTFEVEAYSAPKISKFDVRRGSPSSSVIANIAVGWSSLGTSNPVDIKVVGKSDSGTSATHYTLKGSTAGSLNTTRTFTGQSDASSYTYTITATDSFGKKATANGTVGTAFIELTVAKAKGVGIGKVHERGSLDLAGEAYVSGQLYLSPPVNQNYPYPRLQMHSADVNGHAYIEWFGRDGERKAYVGVPNGNAKHVKIANSINSDRHGHVEFTDQRLSMLDETAYYNDRPVFSSETEKLWEGAIHLQASQTVTPSKPIKDCPHGWILVWSAYVNGSSSNASWDYTFIPRAWRELADWAGGSEIPLMENSTIVRKYVYIGDTTIKGHDRNREAPNNRKVLRYVLAI